MFRLIIFASLLLVVGCDSSRVYEFNQDFQEGQWLSSDTLTFEINIPDSTTRYNVMLNVRNSIDFKTARLFVAYQLSDSLKVLRKRLVEQNLFERKTGNPLGESGLGDIHSHQFLLEPAMSFPSPGLYSIQINHMMRVDTLEEIRSIGIRVERAEK